MFIPSPGNGPVKWLLDNNSITILLNPDSRVLGIGPVN